MPFTSENIKELSKVVSELSNDDIIVTAIPKTIKNSGKDQDVVDFMVTHRATMKYRRGMFRDNLSNFRATIRKSIDSLLEDIVKEITEESAKKPDNSL